MPLITVVQKIDADRARAFVLAHGSLRDRGRAESIFGAPVPNREVVRELETLQNPDGGFPVLQEKDAPSSVDTTCCLLTQMKDMPPLAGSPMASRALAFLRRVQATDGHWEEAPELRDRVPPWACAADPAAAVYLTANATLRLLTMEPGHMDPVSRGDSWVRRAIGAERAEFPTETLGLAAAIWYHLIGASSQEVAAVYQEVSRRDPTAFQLAWWLSAALEVGAGGRYLVPLLGLLNRLAVLQQEDGAWPSEGGGPVEVTLQALRVFRGFALA